MSTRKRRPAKTRRTRSIRAIPPPKARSARRAARASRDRSHRKMLLRRFRRSSRKLLFEMGPWIEARRAGDLPIQLTLTLIDDRWHGYLHDGVEVARRSIRTLQPASAKPQLLPGTRAGRHFERDGSCRCRHFDARAQYRFPRRERKIHMEVETFGAIERLRPDVDVQIQAA